MTTTKPRIICPACGNDKRFLECADNVQQKTLFQQTDDATIMVVSEESKVHGTVSLICAECDKDMTSQYDTFLNLLL